MNPDVKAVHDAPDEGAAAAGDDDDTIGAPVFVWAEGEDGLLYITLPLGGALANVGICS